MKIAIGGDHAAYILKAAIIKHLEDKGVKVDNFGTDTADRVDYPDIAAKVCEAYLKGGYDFAILICGTGVGISMAANKICGIRAGVCTETTTARLIKQHNDANVLCLGARIVGEELAKDIVDSYMNASFEGGRHKQRVDKISALEA